MASYLKASIQRSYAESFLADLERNENQYFFFIGKGTNWTAEPTPDTYVDSVGSEYQAMNDIVGYKKLNPQNIIFALPRYEWASGTVYDQYDDTTALFDDNDPKIFYVVTDENNIYKCLSNNSGATSTEKPAQVLTTPFTTDDGYLWKYISTVKEGDLPYELTDYIPVDFAPVSTDTETVNQYNTQITAVNASITRIKTVNSSGASAGVYTNTITQDLTDGTTSYTLNVTGFNPVTNKISIQDALSVSRLNFTGVNVGNYVGYVLRVNYSEQNATEVNNYAIITGASAISSTLYEFTLQNDVVDFTITPTANGKVASVEIIPYIKIVGNGSGAYAFPTMNTSKQISAVTVVNAGQDYSAALVEVASPKSSVTNHPTLTAVLSPKGGHGSNILKELNTKDILIIVKITEDDAAKIIGGGSYRQFGLIKNPLLSDGTGVVAGKEDLYYRDITLIGVDGGASIADFDSSESNLIVGTESYAAAKVAGVKAINSTTATLKTLSSTGRFITKQDRGNDYSVNLTADPSTDYQVGETVQQIIPAGTVLQSTIGSGISYAFDLTTSGKIITASGATLEVRLTSNGNFVNQPGVTLIGLVSGATGYVSSVSPRYGEYVWVTNSVFNSASFATRGSNQKLYKVVEAGQAYFDLSNTPAYRGVHVLELATSLSSVMGAMDNTSAPLTQNSFSNGDSVYQGVTGTYGHYATGRVYHWEFVNNSYGKLYLTNVVGAFKSVASDGMTGSTLGAYIVASVQEPEIDRSSGEILYIDNVRPIQRTVGQQEEFRLRLGF